MVEQDPSAHRKEQAMPNTNTMQAIVPAAGYYSKLNDPGSLETEVLFGERLEFIEDHGDYVLAKSELYSSPGYVLRTDVAERNLVATHRVMKPLVNAYHKPNFKSGVRLRLSLNSLLHYVASEPSDEGRMFYFDGAGWIFADQVISAENYLADYVQLACSRVGETSPYTWGGRRYPDCSAFVMDVLVACGYICPRNVGEQAQQLGVPTDFSQLRRGDFVFWTEPGTKARHVVIMTSSTHCVHSTIREHLRCIVEQPLSQVIYDQEAGGNGRPTAARRIPKYKN